MKKLLLSLTMLLSVLACNPEKEEIPTVVETAYDSEKFNSEIPSIYGQAMNAASKQQFISKLDQVQNVGVFVFDSKLASENYTKEVQSKFSINDKALSAFNFQPTDQIHANARMATEESITDLIQSSTVYSERIKPAMIHLVETLLALPNPETGYNLALTRFGYNFLISTMTNEDKIHMNAFSQMFRNYFEFINDGGINQIYNAITVQFPVMPGGRTQGCQINTRGVLINAIYSGVKGAIIGGVAGAAGGTAVVPGFGTVTGAVGVGVVGGAVGFAWGTIDAIATQLMETCTRNLTLYDPNCAEKLQQFLIVNTAGKRALLANFPECFKIDDSAITELRPDMSNAETIVVNRYLPQLNSL